mgnify:FL=1
MYFPNESIMKRDTELFGPVFESFVGDKLRLRIPKKVKGKTGLYREDFGFKPYEREIILDEFD